MLVLFVVVCLLAFAFVCLFFVDFWGVVCLLGWWLT